MELIKNPNKMKTYLQKQTLINKNYYIKIKIKKQLQKKNLEKNKNKTKREIAISI